MDIPIRFTFTTNVNKKEIPHQSRLMFKTLNNEGFK